MTTLNRLLKLGLTDKEGAVYLALLELGQANVAQIAKKSGLKRPTTYIILAKLAQSGLAQEIKDNLGSRFQAANPQVIMQSIQRRLQLVRERKKLLPPLITQLSELAKQDGAQPVVKLYEGFNGNSLLVEELHGTGQISFFGDNSTCRDILLARSGQTSHLQEVSAVILVSSKTEIAELNRLAASARFRFNFTPLLVPETDLVRTGLAINDQRLFVFNDYPTGDGIIIENGDIIATCKQIFPYVWQGAQKNKPLSC